MIEKQVFPWKNFSSLRIQSGLRAGKGPFEKCFNGPAHKKCLCEYNVRSSVFHQPYEKNNAELSRCLAGKA